MSAVAILSVVEVIIGWFMKGRGIWSFYKDLKKWKNEKEKKKSEPVKEVEKRILTRSGRSKIRNKNAVVQRTLVKKRAQRN